MKSYTVLSKTAQRSVWRHFRCSSGPRRPSLRQYAVSGFHNVNASVEEKKATFKELGIDKDLYQKASGIRFRQHVNPLKKELQEPTKPLDWGVVYDDPTKPLVLDIGCGYGRFLLGLSKMDTARNGLGLEIRDPIIHRANEWAKHLNLDRRVHFVRSNATVSVATMLETYPGPIELVTIQFPDPHFKKRHRKRRVVQESLVRSVCQILAPDGCLLLQSDVLDVALDMRRKFEAGHGDTLRLSDLHFDGNNVFFEELSALDEDAEQDEVSEWKNGGWLKENPLPVPTERECLVTEQGGKIFRIQCQKRTFS